MATYFTSSEVFTDRGPARSRSAAVREGWGAAYVDAWTPSPFAQHLWQTRATRTWRKPLVMALGGDRG